MGVVRCGAMQHKHAETLSKIFLHPIDMNIDWNKVEHLLENVGAELSETNHGALKVKLNGQEHSFHRGHHAKQIESKDEVIALRHFLESAGVTPGSVT